MPTSDFNWMALVGGGIKLGLKGAVGVTAVYALSWALDSIFGLEVGKPGRVDQKKQLIDELQQINGELDDINACLTAISDELDALNAQMSIDFYKTLSAITSSNVLLAVSAIQASWNNLQYQAGQSAKGHEAPDGFTADFAAQVLANDGIQYQLNVLYNSLLPTSLTSRGLLDTWTSTLILQIQQGASWTSSYQWLEQSFLQYIHYLYYGHGLMLMAHMREAWDSTASLADNQARAQEIGLSYLNDQVAPKLAQVCQFYMQCVHRLILSNYMVPNSQGNGFLSFLSQSDVDYWLSRSSLLTWLITQPVGSSADPGVMVISYLRPSQVSNGQGPVLSPGGDYSPQDGAIFALQYGYADSWYKVVDYSDGDQTSIRDVGSSAIQIANYACQSPAPVVGSALASSGLFARITPTYYDKTSLSPTSGPSDNTVIFGYTTDLTGITDDLAWTSIAGWKGEGAGSVVTGDHDSLVYNVTFANDTGGRNVHTWLTVDGRYKDDAKTLETYMLRLLSYAGSQSGTLYVNFTAQMNGTVTPGGAPAGYSPVPATLSAWAEVPQGQAVTATWSISTPEDDDPPVTMSESVTLLVPVTVQSGENLSVSFVTTSTAEEQSMFKNYSNGAPTYNATRADVSWQINGLTLAWAQPTVS